MISALPEFYMQSEGVNNVILDGPIREEEARENEVAVGYFPSSEDPQKYGAAVHSPYQELSRNEIINYYEKIRRFKLTNRIKHMVRGDSETEEKCLKRSKINGWPTILLTFGRYKVHGEDCVTMHFIAGMPPDKAMSIIQGHAKLRLQELRSNPQK